MRTLLLIVSALCAFQLHADPKKLVIIGDSLTEGFGVTREQSFPGLLQTKLGEKWKVINAGISGSTSASGPSRVAWHLKQKPDLILIALGANDGLRGTSVKAMEENLDKTIDAAKKAGVKVVLVGIKVPPNYGADYNKSFDAVFPKLAKKHDVPLIPFLLDKVAGVKELNLPDGIHPNAKAQPILLDNVWAGLTPLLRAE